MVVGEGGKAIRKEKAYHKPLRYSRKARRRRRKRQISGASREEERNIRLSKEKIKKYREKKEK